jgi:predicted dienelactone hydrolase
MATQQSTQVNKFVGLTKIEVVDRQMGITFPVFVMYPTDVPSKAVAFGPYTLDVSPDAPVEAGNFPLVIISHGSGGSNLAYHTFGSFLAKNGFIVCMPEHPFNNRNDNHLEGTNENFANRLRHISLTIDQMFTADKFIQHLQPDNVGVIGHSIGANTALVLVGGHPIPYAEYQIKFGRPMHMEQEPQEINLKTDTRIKALVLFALTPGWFTGDESLKNVNIPVLIFNAEKDEYIPCSHVEIFIKGLKNDSSISCHIIKNAGHFSFLSPFPESIKAMAGVAAIDPEGFDREKIHHELNAEVLDFFKKNL